ncbi:MAG: hypothetical protein IPI67_36940 [Myxococcales bacterium]|nr:hypothetical protein [Myxococcales bacterium]
MTAQTEMPQSRPTKRNAFVTWLIPSVCFALAPPLGAALGTTPFRLAPTAAIVAGFFIMLFTSISMAKELMTSDTTLPDRLVARCGRLCTLRADGHPCDEHIVRRHQTAFRAAADALIEASLR